MSFVSHNGDHLLMQPEAMAELGWRPGQDITTEQMWEGIAANARVLCRTIERRGDPIDTTRLAALCGHVPSSETIQAQARAIAQMPTFDHLPRGKRH
jgi:hypothetical protein